MTEVPKYVPLSELDQVDPLPRVSFDGVIPEYVDQDQIGVNLRTIHRLLRLGGIRSLHVTGISGDTSSFTPTVVGMDGKGHALGGWIGTSKKVDLFSAHQEQHESREYHGARWTDVTIEVNTSEISARISDAKKRGGVRSPDAWAKQLNRSLKEGIRKEGCRQLIINTTISEKFLHAVYDLSLPMANLRWLLFYHTGTNIIDYAIDKQKCDTNEEGYHLSLFYGPQLDRALALGIAGRTAKLIKAITPEK